MKTKQFNINVSVLNNYTDKQINNTLKKYTKRELLESLLTWQTIAKQHKLTLNELIN